MRIVCSVIYEKDDRVSCPSRGKFDKVLSSYVKNFACLYFRDSVGVVDVSCSSS